MSEFITRIITLYGIAGKEWLKTLPACINAIAVRYHLTELTPLFPLSYHYVLSGFQGEQAIVLKLGLDNENLRREGAALKAFLGLGTVKLIAEEAGMLLIERAVDGISLKTYFPGKDNQAVKITCSLIKRLHQAVIPSKASFSFLRDQLICLDQAWDIPLPYLQKARALRDMLFQSSSGSVLLHGDLHHDNIVRHGKTWLAIDPKGVIGDPAYEVAAFIRNPLPALLSLPNASDLIHNRINQFSEEFSLPSEGILAWCFEQSILSWIWNIEDKLDTQDDQKLAKLFDALTL